MLPAMYLSFHGLQREPFSIAPDPHFLYLSEAHREALAHLLYGVSGGGGFVLLTGEIGAGKTTVCRGFLQQAPAHYNVAYVFNPQLRSIELLQTVCDEFGVTVEASDRTDRRATVKRFIDALNDFLLQAHAAGRHNVLIIDEAQALSTSVLEQLRLLTNLETAERKLLQIILIGQPELRDLVARPKLKQLAQRVIARYHLPALNEADTARYVRHRLAVAGLQGEGPFDDEALRRLHRHSGGVPRRLNLLADRALLGAYAQGRQRVDRSTVDRAAKEVFGDAPLPATQLLRQWGAAGLALAAMLGVGATLWWTLQRAQTTPPAAATRSASAAAANAGLPTTAALNAKPADAARPSAPAAPAEPAAANDTHANAPEADLPRLLAGARRSDSAAWRDLAPLWGLPASDGLNCEGLARQQLPCWRASGGFAELRALRRPVLLQWRDSRGGTLHVPLLGLGTQQALVLLDGRAHRLPLSTLAGLWRGEFTTLWRSPPGYRETVAEPLPAPFSSWLASRLPGDAKQPTTARVAAFQMTQGLRPDGVAGPLTLMLLNQASGVPEPRLATLP